MLVCWPDPSCSERVFFFPLHSFVIWPGNIFLALLTRIATRESGEMATVLMGKDAKEKKVFVRARESEREREIKR